MMPSVLVLPADGREAPVSVLLQGDIGVQAGTLTLTPLPDGRVRLELQMPGVSLLPGDRQPCTVLA